MSVDAIAQRAFLYVHTLYILICSIWYNHTTCNHRLCIPPTTLLMPRFGGSASFLKRASTCITATIYTGYQEQTLIKNIHKY